MRIKNSFKNMYVGIIVQVFSLLINFINRTVFIKTLGSLYLGIGGVFTNLLGVFSLAELGIGQAITFSLYKTIADKDDLKSRALMRLYGKIYRFIGLAILLIGLLLLPFLDIFIKDINNIPNVYIIYLLFLLNSAMSYFWVYRSTFIIANQKNYVISQINFKFLCISSVIQVITLLVFSNYILYLIIGIILTTIQNIFISQKCIKMYPFLKDNVNIPLDSEEKEKISRNIRALLIHKIGTLSLNSTDNIIISAFLGTLVVGYYSNYNLILTSVSGLVGILFSSLTASIGNLVTTENNIKKKQIFNVINFSTFVIYGVCAICLYNLMNPFIEIWIGEEYILPKNISFIIAFNFYIGGMLFAPFNYRQTLGLFTYGKWRPIISAGLNLILSILLVRIIGLLGVLWATAITRILTNVWFDPYIVYRKCFGTSFLEYIYRYIYYLLLILCIGLIVSLIVDFISINTIYTLIAKLFVILGLSGLMIIFLSYKTEEFKYLYSIFSEKLKK